MEENGAPCEENMQFADIVDQCGKELVMKDKHVVAVGLQN